MLKKTVKTPVSPELEMLTSLIDHVLLVAGHHLQALDLVHGKAVTNLESASRGAVAFAYVGLDSHLEIEEL